jgi:hypothetical protein
MRLAMVRKRGIHSQNNYQLYSTDTIDIYQWVGITDMSHHSKPSLFFQSDEVAVNCGDEDDIPRMSVLLKWLNTS